MENNPSVKMQVSLSRLETYNLVKKETHVFIDFISFLSM